MKQFTDNGEMLASEEGEEPADQFPGAGRAVCASRVWAEGLTSGFAGRWMILCEMFKCKLLRDIIQAFALYIRSALLQRVSHQT